MRNIQPCDPDLFLSDFCIALRIHDGQLPSNHIFNDLILIVLIAFIKTDIFAVPHDGQRVGHLHDLCHFVRHKNHCDASFLHSSHDRKQTLHILPRERRSRLVQDQDLRFCRKCARDHQHLLLPNRQPANICIRVKLNACILKELFRPAAQCPVIDKRMLFPVFQVKQKNILCYIHIAQYIDLLRNKANSTAHSVERSTECSWLALDQDLAFK